MARLSLSVTEALELAASQRPLPSEVERIDAQGDALVVTLNARERLPKFLQRLVPRVTLHLAFERFAAGRAAFQVHTSMSALPVNALVQLLLKLISLPELRGVTLDTSGDSIIASVDLQSLVSERVTGVTLTDFRLADNTFFLEAELRNPQPASPKEHHD